MNDLVQPTGVIQGGGLRATCVAAAAAAGGGFGGGDLRGSSIGSRSVPRPTLVPSINM